MKSKRAPFAAASSLILFAGLLPAFSQGLPNTNMGRFVHTPGDNQYENAAQNSRHAAPPPPPRPMAGVTYSGGASAWSPTPIPRMPDISVEPIAADEPVAPAGFPPLPDRFDLGVNMGWGAAGHGGGGGWGMGSGGGGGNGGGGGGGGNSGPPQPTGTHQHYTHYDPGAFSGGQTGGGTHKGANTSALPINPSVGGGGGAQQGDVYMSGGGGGTHKGANTAGFRGGGGGGGGGNPFSGLGREPKLKDKDDASLTPDAPQAVQINQAQTQDLSLPEDEFQYQRPVNPNNKGNRFAKSVGKALLRPVNSVGAYAGIRF